MVNRAFNECAHPERSESGEPETLRPAVSQIGNRVLLALREEIANSLTFILFPKSPMSNGVGLNLAKLSVWATSS
jgi:hypothetical protein